MDRLLLGPGGMEMIEQCSNGLTLERRFQRLEISSLYRSVTRRLIEIYDEQREGQQSASATGHPESVGTGRGENPFHLDEEPAARQEVMTPDAMLSHRTKADSGRSESRRPTKDTDVRVLALGPEPSLDVQQVAKLAGCSAKTVHKLCKTGLLNCHWVGNKRMFRHQDLDDFWKTKEFGSKGRKRSGRVDSKSHRSIRLTNSPRGGDRKGSGSEPSNTEVSKARRLKELSEEMRKW